MPQYETLRDRARTLRTNGTVGEAMLWRHLSRRQVHGQRFLRQRIIGPYIADFCCPALRLIVEIDGVSHVGREAQDARRQRWLETRGYLFLRFAEAHVRSNVEGVTQQIGDYVEHLLTEAT
jgi:very-short-patch-repair endonuclease